MNFLGFSALKFETVMQVFHLTSCLWEWFLYQSKCWKNDDDLNKLGLCGTLCI